MTVNGSVFAPRDSLAFTMKLSNHGVQPVYIPGSFFKYGPLPCAVLPSGKVEYFKAIFGAPECDMLPGDGDIILEVGGSVTFKDLNFAHPEPGVQRWSFEGLLYKCPAVQYSVNCEIESNTVELIVQSER